MAARGNNSIFSSVANKGAAYLAAALVRDPAP